MNQNLTEIALVLDRSGSMGSIKGATVEGVNEFVREQKQQTGDCNFTLVQFDDIYEQVYGGPVKLAPQLTVSESVLNGEHKFEPRGGTALLDAIGRTIDDLGKKLAAMNEADRAAKVIVAIMTDGEENRSRVFKRIQIFDMITLQRETYKWQFLFLGANQDAIQEAAGIGIPMGNAVMYAATGAGVGNTVRAASAMTSAYRATGQAAAMNFTDEERSRAMETDK